MKPKNSAAAAPAETPWERLFAILFGALLGLAIIKFGNPIILDGKLETPNLLGSAWSDPWPSHWGSWLLAALALFGGLVAPLNKVRWPGRKCFWVLPLVW